MTCGLPPDRLHHICPTTQVRYPPTWSPSWPLGPSCPRRSGPASWRSFGPLGTNPTHDPIGPDSGRQLTCTYSTPMGRETAWLEESVRRHRNGEGVDDHHDHHAADDHDDPHAIFTDDLASFE